MSSKADIIQKYKAAEIAAKAALKAAQDLHFSIGVSRQPTEEQRKQMEKKLKEAFEQGHLAESWRGSYYTAYGKMDDAHGDAITWINDEIMEPTMNLGKLYKINL